MNRQTFIVLCVLFIPFICYISYQLYELCDHDYFLPNITNYDYISKDDVTPHHHNLLIHTYKLLILSNYQKRQIIKNTLDDLDNLKKMIHESIYCDVNHLETDN